MKTPLRMTAVALLAILVAAATSFAADELDGDERREARKRLREIQRAWDETSRAGKMEYLQELARYPDRRVGRFLEGLMTGADVDDQVASKAAWALATHGDADDFSVLEKAYSSADTAKRRAAIARWMGMFGEEVALEELRKIAVRGDDSARTAVLALRDIDTDNAWDAVSSAARAGNSPAARRIATGLLLNRGDSRGVDALDRAEDLEDAAAAAHYAVGTKLETNALRVVLKFANEGDPADISGRPHYFGSLLARLDNRESHKAVLDAAGALGRSYDTELGWWLVSVNRAGFRFDASTGWLDKDDVNEILKGLRSLQRLPAPLGEEAQESAHARIAPLLDHEDDQVAAHAMFTGVATGACNGEVKAKVAAWIKDEDPFRRAAALLTAGRAGLAQHGERAIELLKDDNWYVQSAALDALLRLRPASCAASVLDFARAQGAGRLFSEALVLLADLSGVDHGDDLRKWKEWLEENDEFEPAERKLESLRGVPHTVTRDRSAATFYGLRINSTNVQFALDRSISMVNPVRREPDRPGFDRRKQDILRRRPAVARMMRDGFLPRFYVAAGELGAALDGMDQGARFGITLFNHETMHHERANNSIGNRRAALNWMLSTNIQGGTDIEAALLEIIEAGEADTILLLSDGEPLSLAILERIARANAVKRVDIMVVSIHEELYHRHYLDALATRHYGTITDAEPEE